MADQEEGVPAPNPHLASVQAPKSPQAPHAPQGHQLIHLNWSYFKPEFSGKPDEDAEEQLNHTNDWINAHHFNEGVKVQIFCLTLLGEARLWYQSLEPINIDWQGLQIYLGNNTLKLVTLEDNYFMHGDLLILMRIQRQ